jgi:hypothetical protein
MSSRFGLTDDRETTPDVATTSRETAYEAEAIGNCRHDRGRSPADQSTFSGCFYGLRDRGC